MKVSPLRKSVILLMVIAGLNVALAYLRETVVAYYFGVSGDLDTFLVAVSIPQIIGTEILGIAVTVLLPTYVSLKAKHGGAAAAARARRWVYGTAAIITAGAVLVYALAPSICRLLAPGFTGGQAAKAAEWMRLSTPVMFFLGMSGMSKLVLDGNRRFFFPALSRGMGSAAFALACVLLSGRPGGLNLVWAMLASSLVILAFSSLPLLPGLFSARGEDSTQVSGPSPEDSRIASLVLIVGANSLVFHCYSLIDRGFASTLGAGSIAVLNYGNMLINVTSTLFSMAIATVIFPELSGNFAKGEHQSSVGMTRKAMRLCAGVYAGAAAVLAGLSRPLVSLLLQRGRFNPAAAASVAAVLSILAVGLVPSGLWDIMRVFFRAQNLHVYLLHAAFIVLVSKIILNYALLGYGVDGLAMSSSATTWLGYGYLYYRFSRNARELVALPA